MISMDDHRLPTLIAAAEDAYRQVRLEIINTLPPCTPIDVSALNGHQRRTLNNLNRAEDELARYREREYAAV
jgi:hypothetical protein